MLFEEQLDEDELEPLVTLESSLELDELPDCEEDSPDDEDDPPPLQEITRILKRITIRKKRSFFIYFL